MYRIFAFLLIPFASFFAEAQTVVDSLRNGDLLFQSAADSDFSDAIVKATGTDSLNFVHVGIFFEKDSIKCVVEATPQHGVKVTRLERFLAEAPATVAMRYDPELGSAAAAADAYDSILGSAAVVEALKLIGRPYDRRFAEGDSAVYCSELVQIAFRRAAGSEIFESIPMNFLGPDGTMPEFWIELFRREGCPIPQGSPGTNPNSIARKAKFLFLLQAPHP